MRNLIFSINLSADGCCDHTKFFPDKDVFEYFIDLMRQAGTLLYGRKTYQLMVPYWPDIARNRSGASDAEHEFALAFDAVDNMVVVSRTLEKVEATNTRIVRTNVEDEILKLKQQPGKDIMLGGVDLSSQLMQTGLIDEYRLVVHPLLAGEGAHLLQGISLQEKIPLKLAGSKVFGSGAIELRYLKA